jgi:very-short-patch-repair endonuclease
VVVEAASGDRRGEPARIRRVLQVSERGERGLALIGAAQRGVVRRSQLVEIGIGRGSIAHRVKIGSLHRVLPAVYAIGHPALESSAFETAALLYCGHDVVLSHGTAAALWGLLPDAPPEVSVTLAGRNVGRPTGLRVHRVAVIDARDVRLRQGLPVTSPARTMIDFASEASSGAVEAALNEARVQRLVTDESLGQAMARCPLRSGVGRLRALLTAERGPSLTRSETERRLRFLVERGELPWPQFNVWLFGHLVDAVWPEAKLVVEVDGYGVHGHRRAFESDRRRDQRMAALGFVVVRVTARQLRDEPMAVLGRLAQALALARARRG